MGLASETHRRLSTTSPSCSPHGETNPVVTIVGQAANVGTGDVTFSSGDRTYPVLEDWSHLLSVVEHLTGRHLTLGC